MFLTVFSLGLHKIQQMNVFERSPDYLWAYNDKDGPRTVSTCEPHPNATEYHQEFPRNTKTTYNVYMSY